MRGKRITLAAIGLGALVYPKAAHAVKFTFNPAPNTPQEVVTGFNLAGQRWSNNLKDGINLKITIQFSSLADNRLAETDTAFQQLTYNYADVVAKLTANALSADDLSAVSHLQSGNTFNLLLNRTKNSPYGSGSATPFLDADNDDNNLTIRAPMANFKALGYSYSSSYSDATITFNSDMPWDYDPANGISAGKYDFTGIVTHEIGHVLGILSGADVLDSTKGAPVNDNLLTYVSVMDLFRFSTQSLAQGNGVIDLTADTRDKYFSVDGGTTKIASFATGVNFGDGTQASHWKDNRALGIFDPTATTGELLSISDNDLRLLDVIGFDRNNNWQWAAPQNGKWSDATNWNTASVPTPAITASFTSAAASTYTVNFTAPATAQILRVGNNAVTFQLTGQTLTVATEATLAEKTGETAALTLAGPGTLTVPSLSIGGNSTAPGGAATLNLATGATLSVANTLKIWNTPGTGLAINGGSLSAASINNSGNFDFAAGNLSVSGNFLNTAGAARFAGQQTWANGSRLVVSGGTVRLLTDAGAAGQPGALSIDVQPGAQVDFEATQHLKALSIAGGNAALTPGGQKTLVLETLSIDALGKLDLTDNDLVIQVNNGNPADVLTQITQLIRSARNDNAELWTGPGLTSSSARYSTLTGLAIALNDQGAGHLLDPAWGPNIILVKYTWIGDINLDGSLNLNDYFAIDTGYLGQGRAYTNGDVNYDGVVNLNDYFLIDSAYLGQISILGQTAHMVLLDLPEPGAPALLLLATTLLPRRRRQS
jgi:hypothetical protein